MRWANKATIGVGALLVVGVLVYNYYDVKEMSDLGQEIDMRMLGECTYEYHALTGKWPSQLADLAITSHPLKYPDWWAGTLVFDANAIVCPKDLKPNPKENGHVILCYHNKGLDAERGRMWVCWGDLRTECITPEALQKHLNKQDNVAIPARKKD